jgi:hypothetical protein
VDVTDDEPLEGDIGPAPSSAAASAPEEDRAALAEELRRYEAEREERRRHANAVAGRVVAVVVALLLGFLAYDSISTALEARRRDDPWVYPPATIAALCLLGLIILIAWALRRRG